MGILYYKLEAFIPNTKDVWDFGLGGLKKRLKNKFVFLKDDKGIKEYPK
ncbi:hypothetical protein HMPREF4655_21180 [Helicobacter pylori 35A]|nr:hypothetical protein HMPREF4655_21180 [Helicobacter pylori 35A]GHR69487.1 hypothetical protein JP0104_12520 [Helicobacter pylori]